MKTYKYRLNNVLSDIIVKVISKSNSSLMHALIAKRVFNTYIKRYKKIDISTDIYGFNNCDLANNYVLTQSEFIDPYTNIINEYKNNLINISGDLLLLSNVIPEIESVCKSSLDPFVQSIYTDSNNNLSMVIYPFSSLDNYDTTDLHQLILTHINQFGEIMYLSSPFESRLIPISPIGTSSDENLSHALEPTAISSHTYSNYNLSIDYYLDSLYTIALPKLSTLEMEKYSSLDGAYYATESNPKPNLNVNIKYTPLPSEPNKKLKIKAFVDVEYRTGYGWPQGALDLPTYSNIKVLVTDTYELQPNADNFLSIPMLQNIYYTKGYSNDVWFNKLCIYSE